MYNTTPPFTIAEQQPTKPLQGKAVGVGHNRRKFSNHIYRKAYTMNTPRNHGKEWNKQIDAILLNYKKNGYSNQQTAFYMERTEFAIECRLKYLKEREKEMPRPFINKENAKKYLTILQAYTKGETIEVLNNGTWHSLSALTLSELIDNYRVQPKWYRVAKLKYIDNCIYTDLANDAEREEEIEYQGGFICWLTERIEY